ncbi:hypothetical protein [Amnibacterium sp.]|uniref:hypothetical protein n=1 Tax=Amnibacterium sp. TaxID=1872496 RepID=UPI003F7C6BE4
MTVVRSVLVTVVGVGNETFGSPLPEAVTLTASDADPEGGHASGAALAAVDADEADEDDGDDDVFGEEAAQPASRTMPLTAARAGRSRRGGRTEAS